MRHKRRIISIGLAAIVLVSLCAVCASTGVTAATTSGGTQASASLAKLTDIVGAPPGGLASAPAVCSWGNNRLDVFAKGTDNNLWHTWFDGIWHSWENLGGPSGGRLYSGPTAVSWGAGRIDVFAAGGDANLIHKWFDNGWHDWESLGVPAGKTLAGDTAPAACSWGANRLDIFVTGSDGQLWQKWFNNGWQSWVPLGKPSAGLEGSLGAVSTSSWGYPRVDIFVRGSDGALWQLWWNNGWQAWHRFEDTVELVAAWPGQTAPPGTPEGYYGWFDYAPAVCSWGANRLDVFFVDTSGHLQQKWFNGNWQPLYNVGGTKFLTASPTAVAWQNAGITRIDIFARGGDFSLWQLYFAADGSGWHGWFNLGTVIS